MKILAIEKELPAAQPVAGTSLLKAEARVAWDLHQAGVIRELYFRADQNCAVLVLECETTAAAREILAGLPLVQTGQIEFELIPLRAYPGFSRLFADDIK